MAVRKIIKIDEDKCDACGLCVTACHEGAIQIVDGKAKLVSEVYCDGLGDCLGECPQGAITIEEREAEPFDVKAVEKHLAELEGEKTCEAAPAAGGGCPGSALRKFQATAPPALSGDDRPSQLGHWPVQLMLVPPGAPFLQGADVLIAADCTPFATANFHEHYLAGKALLVGCPKLDDIQHYYEKLKAIFAAAKPASVTVLRMEVPCCGGIANAVARARAETIPDTDLRVVTLGVRGDEQSVEAVPPA
jgi:ferredoxin